MVETYTENIYKVSKVLKIVQELAIIMQLIEILRELLRGYWL